MMSCQKCPDNLPTHQNRPVTKMPQGYDRQHNVSTPMQSQNRLPVATKQSVHQIRDASTATVVPTRQALTTQTDDQIQEETSRMQAPDQDQDILAQAMMQGNIPMTADASEMLSEDTFVVVVVVDYEFVGLYGVESKCMLHSKKRERKSVVHFVNKMI